MVLCVLATDAEDEDIALQIHFTLLQAFCCDNDVNILRLSGMRRLTQLLEPDAGAGTEPRDLHCILVTVSLLLPIKADRCARIRETIRVFPVLQNPPARPLQCRALQRVSSFCQESRGRNQWVPCLELQDR